MAYNGKKFLDQGGAAYLWKQIEIELAKKQAAGDYASNSRVATAEGRIATLEGKHASGKTVAQEVSDGIAASGLSTYQSKVDTLIDDDTGKSVRDIAAEEIAAQLIPDDAAQALDTLQEIADWIQDHPGDVATINSTLTAIQTKLTLGKYKDANDNLVEYASVREYVQAYVTNALSNYAYSPTNAEALDQITTTLIDNWSAAYAAMHTHDNKAALDTITATKISNWDAAENNAKVYADSLASNYDSAGEAQAVYSAIQTMTNNEIDAAISAGKTAAASSSSEETT